MIDDLRPPLVTNADRDWALSQCPVWAVRGGLFEEPQELVDPEDERPKPNAQGVLNWDQFVMDQIERFERHFAHDRKTYADWSTLWRKSWWPKADARKLFPKLAPAEFHPFFRRGSPEFDRAMAVATSSEKFIWDRIGVAQFKPDDKRLKRVQFTEPPKSVRGKLAAAGDA